MSELDTSTAAADASTAPPATPDVSSIASGPAAAPDGAAAATSSSVEGPGAPETDVFAGLDTDSIFGLEKEPASSDDTADVTTAPDQPAPRQGESIATEDPDSSTEGQGDTTQTKDDTGFKFNEKLNWENGNTGSQVPFREEFKALKEEYQRILASSPESQFISSPQDFAAWMKEKSPTSYNQVGALLATESATSHPEQWIDFFLEDASNADLIAKKISGRDDMTAERLRAELEVVLDEDDPDVKAVMERRQAEAKAAETGKPEETPEQKRIRELLEKEERREMAEFRSQVFGPVEKAVNGLISQAGLEIDDSVLDGKSPKDLDPETRFKVLVNDLMPTYIGRRADADPVLKNMQARLAEFEKAKDITSALAMQHAIKIAVTNIASEFLEIITAKRAQAKAEEDIPPTNGSPPPIVRSAGASTSPAAAASPAGPLSDDDWKVTEADLIRR